jgi:hypothetical protein
MNTYPEFSIVELNPTDTEIIAVDSVAEGEGVLGRDEILTLWATEARRRLEEMRSGAVKGIPVDKAFALIRQELGLR